MDTITRITAISGWALPSTWFAGEVMKAFPGSSVKIIYPENPENSDEAKILLDRHPADLYIGYSLGSLWLMKYKDFLPVNSTKALLAPILSFLNNDGLGGTTSETQLKYLARLLKQKSDKVSALMDFFSYSDLPYPKKFIKQVPDKDILLRGLEFLKTYRASGNDAKKFLSILGENDIFIDSSKLKEHIPHIDIVEGVGHAPGNLLKHLSIRLKWKTYNL